MCHWQKRLFTREIWASSEQDISKRTIIVQYRGNKIVYKILIKIKLQITRTHVRVVEFLCPTRTRRLLKPVFLKCQKGY